MTDKRTINQMKVGDLRNLVTELLDKINAIEKAHNKIAQIADDAIIAKTQDHMRTINRWYGQIFGNSMQTGAVSIKEQIDDWIESLKEHEDKFDAMEMEMHGGVTVDEEGNEQEKPGYIKAVKEKLDGYEDRYTKLYNRIEKTLLPGATTVELTKHFNAKMKEYSTARKIWEGVVAILFVCGFGILVYLAANASYPTNWREWVFWLLRYAPAFSIFIWLMVWAGNRRAENHKLEESYKHKEVMAQSFTGYKKSIEEISGNDKELLETLMRDLLDAIKQDSSAFLSAKGENPPITDVVQTVLDQSKKVAKDDK